MPPTVISGKSKYVTRTVGDGLCGRDDCLNRKLKGRRYCFDHELEEEEAEVVRFDPDTPTPNRKPNLFEQVLEGTECAEDLSDGRVNIYVIGIVGDDKAVKIGQTVGRVGKRLRALQVSHYQELRLITAMPLPMAFESRIHEALADYCIRGEWFSLEGKTEAVVRALMTGSESEVTNAMRS